MKWFFTPFVVVCMTFVVNGSLVSANRDGDAWWENSNTPMDLTITHVEIRQADGSMEDDRLPLNPQPSNVMIDGFTNDPFGPPPPDEHYFFVGGGGATINHVVDVGADLGPFPLPLSLAFIWQTCGNGVIYPPLPATIGTSFDGTTISLTLPFSGSWYISVGISGFSPGEWDWMALARYDGTTPIPIPPAPDTDGIGGMTVPPWILFGINPQQGCCLGWERPWCFSLL